ncbi:MAG: hypothetical protein K0S09_318 [Sphingobacteriaceae bacterium]|jgi:hypothetical protein|nr:hypothetical protein [Sphingobacteriaceae bacterium]
MKKLVFLLCLSSGIFLASNANAQIDLENLKPKDILGRVMRVENGFSPKFYLGNIEIRKIVQVAEILGMKKNSEVDRLFRTFRSGRTVFKIASYAGTAVTAYGAIKAVANSTDKQSYQSAIVSGATAIGTGVLVKLLTKGAANKAVDIFNHAAQKKIKDIFKIGAASETMGVGLYVKL